MTASPSTIRVAAAQFASDTDVDANLETCVRMIRNAAESQPDLIVLPEFCNHISVYESADHCRDVAVTLDGAFLTAIAAEAANASAWVVLAVTIRHDDDSVTITNVMFDRNGNLVETSDKQVLMGNERQYLSPGTTAGPIIASDFGPIAMYSCMEGVVFEPPRSLAVRGARLMTNSLNSFGLDEASLHIPVRAAENRVFIVAANKVGPLIPQERVADFAEAMGIPPSSLDGAGESQIVSPDGDVLAKAPRTGEAVIVADIDLREAEDKRAAGGTDLHSSRRPDIYQPLGSTAADEDAIGIGRSVRTAVLNTTHLPGSLPEAELVVLPELVGVSADPNEYPDTAARESLQAVETLRSLLGDAQALVVTTIVESTGDGFAHSAVAIGRDGVAATQRQVHPSSRHPWVDVLGASIGHGDAQWGRYGLLAGDDVLFPESFRLAAVRGASVIAASTHVLDRWVLSFGIAERAAENRINVVVASSFDPGLGGGAALLDPDMTLWLPDRSVPFDGTINDPTVTLAERVEVLVVEVYPSRATNKLVSAGTDLVNGRPVDGAGASLTR